MKPIIALTGKMLSGKSEVTKYLIKKLRDRAYSTRIIKFAEPLYDIQKYVYQRIGVTPPLKDRKLLQFLGSDWGRSINPDIWINIWDMSVKTARMFNNVGVVLCDDVRFNNEAMRVRKLGGIVIKINAEDKVRAKRGEVLGASHISEHGVIPELVDFTIENNFSLEALHMQIDRILETLEK